MPKAKLVTRTSSTTSVTTDNIPKGSGLTNAELDSNFLNLRDQGFRIRADDSTQHTVTADTQVNFSGATVTSSGGDLTIETGGGNETITALTSSTAITVDCSLGNFFTVTLAHNATFTLSNFSTGQAIAIKITQDGTGSRTATFSGLKFAFNNNSIGSTANETSLISIFNDGTDKLAAINTDYQ
jgi:hypothetical protein